MSEQNLSHEVKGMACRSETGLCWDRSGEDNIFFCCVEGSQENLASIILNGWSLKQSGLFLDLASWPNWAIEGEGSWLERWSRQCRSGLGTTECPRVAQPELGLGTNQTSLEKPRNGCPLMVPSQPDRAWDDLKANGKKIKCRCAKLVASYTKIPEAVIDANVL